jgi:AcrR family transcriptional regulator
MTKHKLMAIAMKQFGEKGYNGTALSAIAAEAGVKTPAIYAFYESKEDLFMTAFREAMQMYNRYVETLLEEPSIGGAQERLYRVLQRQYEFYQQSTEINLMVLRFVIFPPAFLKPAIGEAFEYSDKLLTQIIGQLIWQGMAEGAIRTQPPELLVDAFLNLMDGLSLQYFYYPDHEVYERKMNHAFEIFWNGAM